MTVRRTRLTTRAAGLAAAVVVLGTGTVAVAGVASSSVAANPAATQFVSELAVGGPLPVAGSLLQESARLTARGHGVSHATVQLQVKRFGTSTYAVAATTTTSADGTATAAVRLWRNASIRWSYAGSNSYAKSTSAPLAVEISTRVFVTMSDTTPATGQRIVFRGRTNPLKPGATVSLWSGSTTRGSSAYLATQPVRLATATIGSDGHYRIVFRFAHTGRKHLFVQVTRTPGNAPGWSPYLTPTVH